MKRISRKLLYVIVAASVLLSAVSCMIVAFAVDNPKAGSQVELSQAIIDAGTTPTTIEITNDFNVFLLPIELTAGADITLIPSSGDVKIYRDALYGDGALFNVPTGAKLTIGKSDSGKIIISGNNVNSTKSAVTVNGTFITDGVVFSGHKSSANGSAISADGGKLTISNSTFDGNEISGADYGGAIYSFNTQLDVIGSTFTNNKSSSMGSSGGAISVYATAAATGVNYNLKNCTFDKNYSSCGGAVYVTLSDGLLDGCTFTNNEAYTGLDMSTGGAVAFVGYNTVTITSGRFEKNKCDGMGGAVYADGATQLFLNNETAFENNHAKNIGGAIWHCPFGTAHWYKYSGFSFYGNTADVRGDDIGIREATAGSEAGGEFISDKNFYDDDFNWYYDTADARYSDGVRNPVTDSTYYQGSNAEIDMHCGLTKEQYDASKDMAQLIFIDNEGIEGGAVAVNGYLTSGVPTGLVIEKEVKGDDAPVIDEFTFTITFSDKLPHDGIDNGGKFTLKNGEKLVIAGIPEGVTYEVTEEEIDNYTPDEATITGTIGAEGSSIKFVNTYVAPPDTVSVTVTKVWDGEENANQPESIEVQLYNDGETAGDPITLDDENDWTYTFVNLDKDGKWTVDEVNTPKDYKKTVTNDGNNWVIKNTYDPETTTTTTTSTTTTTTTTTTTATTTTTTTTKTDTDNTGTHTLPTIIIPTKPTVPTSEQTEPTGDVTNPEEPTSISNTSVDSSNTTETSNTTNPDSTDSSTESTATNASTENNVTTTTRSTANGVGDDSSTNAENNSSTNGTTGSSNGDTASPNTGDTAKPLIIALAVISFGIVVFVTIQKKKSIAK